MSADNFWLVRRTADSKFAPVMGFASDTIRPTVEDRHGTFLTPDLALASVIDDWAEYGHSIDPECYLPAEDWQTVLRKRGEALDTILSEIRWRATDEDATVEQIAARIADVAEEIWHDGESAALARQLDRLKDTARQLDAAQVERARLEARVAELEEWNTGLANQVSEFSH